MAQRRMLSKQITETDMFMDMPLSAQALYLHLIMNADDDGFIGNAKTILRMVGGSNDDLKLLIAKQFIIAFDDGITVIRDWRIHNYIRQDRHHKTMYDNHLKELTVADNGAYQRNAAQAEICQPSDNQVSDKMATEVRLGKVRLGKDIKPLSGKPDPIPYAEIISYLNQVTGKSFKNVETHKKLIRARWHEKATLDDFKKVIDNKSSEWLGTDMAKYLQPSTLFGNKFDQYLNQQTKVTNREERSNSGVEF
ncbi:conserved phage C-terminal domain-containing protein [Latilactobacillus sakei]